MLGDEPALRRAVVNLVANALRLAPAGSTISLASRAVDGWIELEVRDEGRASTLPTTNRSSSASGAATTSVPGADSV
ncbi:MAG: ATP-binding protein [Acidimicrobiales bacterium]